MKKSLCIYKNCFPPHPSRLPICNRQSSSSRRRISPKLASKCCAARLALLYLLNYKAWNAALQSVECCRHSTINCTSYPSVALDIPPVILAPTSKHLISPNPIDCWLARPIHSVHHTICIELELLSGCTNKNDLHCLPGQIAQPGPRPPVVVAR